MESFSRRLDEHIEQHRRENEEIHGILVKIRDNHLAHIEPVVKALETDVDWLKRMTWIVMGASLSGMIGVIYQIAAKR